MSARLLCALIKQGGPGRLDNRHFDQKRIPCSLSGVERGFATVLFRRLYNEICQYLVAKVIDKVGSAMDMIVEQDVGLRLRKVRVKLGLSQRLLARRAGVPSSTVSLIESGRSNPSIGSLKRVLEAAGLSFAEFFSFEMSREQKVFFHKSELSEISSSKDVSYLQVGRGAAASTLQILYETYQPGADSGRVMLTHEGEEGAVVISGKLEVTVGDQTRVLKAGDAYLFPSITPHRFRNVGDTPCVVVSACTPPSF